MEERVDQLFPEVQEKIVRQALANAIQRETNIPNVSELTNEINNLRNTTTNLALDPTVPLNLVNEVNQELILLQRQRTQILLNINRANNI